MTLPTNLDKLTEIERAQEQVRMWLGQAKDSDPCRPTCSFRMTADAVHAIQTLVNPTALAMIAEILGLRTNIELCRTAMKRACGSWGPDRGMKYLEEALDKLEAMRGYK